MIKAMWLANQSASFIRNFATLSRPPLSLTIDPPFIERLIETIAALAIAGLKGTNVGASVDRVCAATT